MSDVYRLAPHSSPISCSQVRAWQRRAECIARKMRGLAHDIKFGIGDGPHSILEEAVPEHAHTLSDYCDILADNLDALACEVAR